MESERDKTLTFGFGSGELERRAEEIGVVVGVFVGGAGRNGAVGSQLKQRVVFSGDFDEGEVGVGLHFTLSLTLIPVFPERPNGKCWSLFSVYECLRIFNFLKGFESGNID